MEPELQELKALLEYLVKHNEDHAAEVLELAERARSLGKTDAYEQLTQGVTLMDKSNKSLRAALTALEA